MSALVKRIALALQPRHRCRIGLTGPYVQSFAVLAGLVGVDQSQVLIQTFVDRHCRRPATSRKRNAAQCQKPSAGRAIFLDSTRCADRAHVAPFLVPGSRALGALVLDPRRARRRPLTPANTLCGRLIPALPAAWRPGRLAWRFASEATAGIRTRSRGSRCAQICRSRNGTARRPAQALHYPWGRRRLIAPAWRAPGLSARQPQ
jgi:hypothetical protein